MNFAIVYIGSNILNILIYPLIFWHVLLVDMCTFHPRNRAYKESARLLGALLLTLQTDNHREAVASKYKLVCWPLILNIRMKMRGHKADGFEWLLLAWFCSVKLEGWLCEFWAVFLMSQWPIYDGGYALRVRGHILY